MRRPSRLRRSDFAHRKQIAAFKSDMAGCDGRVRRQQPEHRAAQHGFSGTGFADQPAYFARFDLEADPAQHVGVADGDLQTFNGERGGHERCTGSSASRRPSPSRLRPITLAMMQPIGSAMIHGA